MQALPLSLADEGIIDVMSSRDKRDKSAAPASDINLPVRLNSIEKDLWWIIRVGPVIATGLLALGGWMIKSYIPNQARQAANDAVSPLSQNIATLVERTNDIAARLERLQLALAAVGHVDAAALHQQFQSTKQRIARELADEKPGSLPSIEAEAQQISATLVADKIPTDLINEGVSALVHVVAYHYFTQMFPSHPPNLVIRESSFINDREAIHIGPNVSVIADNVLVRHCGQDLAGIYWIHTIFENSDVRYEGGPLYLADVTFKNCTFSFGKDAQSQNVKRAILGSRGKPTSVMIAEGFDSLLIAPATENQ
jgi:hypothetical protein